MTHRWTLASQEVGGKRNPVTTEAAGRSTHCGAFYQATGAREYRLNHGFHDSRAAASLLGGPLRPVQPTRMRTKEDIDVGRKTAKTIKKPDIEDGDTVGLRRQKFVQSVEASPRRQQYDHYLYSSNPSLTTHNAEYGKSRERSQQPAAGFRYSSYPDCLFKSILAP